MEHNQKEVLNSDRRPQKSRTTIGLLIRNVSEWVYQLQWSGTADVAQEQDVNLICFTGGALNSSNGFEAQANILYKLINIEQLDGLVISIPSLSFFINQEEIAEFTKQFNAIPTIEPSLFAVGRPQREVIAHLVKKHNCHRIAFIRGPENHDGAEIRYRDYIETLADHGLPFDPKLVVEPDRDWLGKTEIRRFLDRRNLPKEIDFDAIVGANDERALIMLKELQNRGVQIPNDVAVIGTDNQPESRVSNPPLTTLQFPLYEQGRKLAEIFLAHLQGEEIPAAVNFAYKLIIRRSCGCLPPTVTQAAVRRKIIDRDIEDEAVQTPLNAQRAKLVAKIVQAVEPSTMEVVSDWAEELATTLASELSNAASDSSSPLGKRFLLTLERVLFQAAEAGADITSWQNAISTLHRHLLPHLSHTAQSAAVEDIWSQARVLINEVERWQAANQRQLAEYRAAILREVRTTLITTFDVGELLEILARELPRLNIPGCYLSLYENPQNPTGWARLRLAYNEQGRIEIKSTGIRFRSPQLMPAQMWPQNRRFSLLVQPLYFQESQIGFVLFEIGPRDGNIYESLSRHISSALKGALLVEQVESHAAFLEAEVKMRTSDLTLTNTQLRHEIIERKRVEEELKTSLQEKEVLFKEIHHRVKNNMQIISSLLDLQADTIQDELVRGLFRESQQRIRSMALVHEQLYQSSDLARIDFAEYIERLTNHIFRSYRTRIGNITVRLNIAPLFLGVETAIPCGLIINELVSNAFKHAFPNDRAGEIWIELQVQAGQDLTLSVRDNGIGLPPDLDLRQTRSLGLTLVTTLVKQLKGQLETNQQNGTTFAVTFSDIGAQINRGSAAYG